MLLAEGRSTPTTEYNRDIRNITYRRNMASDLLTQIQRSRIRTRLYQFRTRRCRASIRQRRSRCLPRVEDMETDCCRGMSGLLLC